MYVLFGQRQEHNTSTALTKHSEALLIQSSLPMRRKIKATKDPKRTYLKQFKKVIYRTSVISL